MSFCVRLSQGSKLSQPYLEDEKYIASDENEKDVFAQ